MPVRLYLFIACCRFAEIEIEQVALKKLYSNRLRTVVKETGKRCDGRKTDEVSYQHDIQRLACPPCFDRYMFPI